MIPKKKIFRMSTQLEIRYLRLVINNVFPIYKNDQIALDHVKNQIEQKIKQNWLTENRLEEKIISAVKRGDDLKNIYLKLMRICEKRASGVKLFMTMLIAMFYFIKCGKELKTRRVIKIRKEQATIDDILVETCVRLRSVKQNTKNRQSFDQLRKLFGKERPDHSSIKHCTIIVVGMLALVIQRYFLNLAVKITNMN